MDKQSLFEKVIRLLASAAHNNIATELLNHYINNEITFSGNEDGDKCNSKDHLVEIYTGHQLFEETRPEKFTFGYEDLMPALTNTLFDSIAIFSIDTEIGSFIIFTDKDIINFIGILKSRRTLGEIRKSYADHAALLQKFWKEPLYDYKNNEVVFLNGKLV